MGLHDNLCVIRRDRLELAGFCSHAATDGPLHQNEIGARFADNLRHPAALSWRLHTSRFHRPQYAGCRR